MSRRRDGDRAAFEPVFLRVRPLVERFASRTLADPIEAEDAAQQALLNVFRRASEYDPERDALSWILGITAYECLTARTKRRRRREEPLPERFTVAHPDPTPEAAAIERDLALRVEGLLAELAPADAEAIRASAGIGERPAIAPATFRKRVERALIRARSLWRTIHGVD